MYHWKLDPTKVDNDPELERIRASQGYTYHDFVTCSPDKLPCYEEKIKSFFEEHIHADDEVRYCVEGSGYFDVRDKQDQWIRIAMTPGDLITLPAGASALCTCAHVFPLPFAGQPVAPSIYCSAIRGSVQAAS